MTWQRIWSWHEGEWVVARLTGPAGQALLLAATWLLLPPPIRIPVGVAVGVGLVAPAWRIEILAAGALWVLYRRIPASAPAAGPLALATGMAAVLALLAACYLAARRFRSLPAVVRRFPIGVLHGVLLGLLALAATAAVRGSLGGWLAGALEVLAALIPFLLWRASYLMLSGRRGSAATSRFIDHLFYLLPLWGGSATPYGKGWDYLRQQRQVDPVALARCRAAGLKLLGLALLWRWVARGLELLESPAGLALPGWLGGWSVAVPDLADAIRAGPGQLGLSTRWLITGLELFRSVVDLAASGHVIIGVLRLLGFDVFRNTYKPLLAASIVEFWNRYYYYFKELLVEFFFYPTFLALSRRRIETRIVLSVFAAASVGNLYYHLIAGFGRFFGAGFHEAVHRVGSRAVYSFILGLGVAASMLRERRRRGAPPRPPSSWNRVTAVRAVLGVWLFYSLLHVWNVGGPSLHLDQRLAFLLGLFGL